MSSPAIRPIEDGDVAGAVSALVDVHQTDGYPVEGVARPEAWIRSPGIVQAWVADLDGVVVGHVAVMRPRGDQDAVALWREQSGEDDSRICVVARLFTVRRVRGLGVGEALMRQAMAFARERSWRLVLDVVAKDVAAARLYERLGWQAIGEVEHRYGDGHQIPARCYVWPTG